MRFGTTPPLVVAATALRYRLLRRITAPRCNAVAATIVVLALLATGTAHAAYDYPLIDPLAATVIGTPPDVSAKLPTDLTIREFKIRGMAAEPVPELFWYEDGLKVSLVMQKTAAPLIFVVAGTGAGHDTKKMRGLQRTFAKAGMHVLSLPSPTHLNFILNASTRRMPGIAPDDAADLYRVMQQAYDMVRDWVTITDFYVTGYSLGAMHTAFVTELDERRQVFNFKKALMINPPVDLMASARLLDDMLENNIDGGIDGIPAFFDELVRQLAQTYRVTDELSFDSDFLYAAFETQQFSDREFGALIGVAFRITSTDIMMTADVVHHTGIFVPANVNLTYKDPLDEYLLTMSRFGFTDYFEEFLYPYYVARDPNVTRDELIYRSSLYSIEDYLRRSDKFAVMTNADEIILRPEDVAWLMDVFGDRVVVYPNGGHCGNMEYPVNVDFMIDVVTK